MSRLAAPFTHLLFLRVPINIKLYLHTDGAARGNPGPAAAGIVIGNEQGKVIEEFGKRLGYLTSNEAEYRALVLGIKRARELGATELVVRLDSELLVRQLTGVYKVKAPHLKPLMRQVLDELKRFSSYSITHVPREMNDRADSFANMALDDLL